MKSGPSISLSLFAAASLFFAQGIFAQDTTSSGWKPVGGGTGQAPALQQNTPPPGVPNPAPATPPPAQLTLKSGTYITVRVNQYLSSDKNQAGDAFTATLVRPLVVDGFVVARPGQTIAGRVAEATKAGRAKGVSHLGLQLTDLTFADGQQASIQSELVTRTGPTSVGRDATAIGTTTGVGAAIGAAAAGGPGAAIGAGAGAVASTVGVLLTRGKPTIIGPESVLTFKINSDVMIATDRAPQAFRAVSPSDYAQPTLQTGRSGGYAPPPGGAYYAGSPYYGYPYYGYPYYGYPYWGPGIYFGGGWGGRFGGRGRFR